MRTIRAMVEDLRGLREGADLAAGTFLMWLTGAPSPQASMGRLRAMLGMTQIVTDKGSVKIGFKGSRKANVLIATINAGDTYDLEFGIVQKLDYRTVLRVSDVPGAEVRKTFTKVTGLDTSL